MFAYAVPPPPKLTPPPPANALRIVRSDGFDDAVVILLPPPASSLPVSTSVTAPPALSVEPPLTVRLWTQYVPAARVADLPPFTVRSPFAASYVNEPLMPVAALNGEHAVTASGAS